MTGYSVEFLGCKVSHTDAQAIEDALASAGHVFDDAGAVQVVNACCITSVAERSSRQRVARRLAAGDAVSHVFVTGCGAANAPEQYTSIDPRVRVLPGAAALASRAIVEAADALSGLACRGPVAGIAPGHEPDLGGATAAHAGAQRPRVRTRAFVKVQDGCDFHCSYCIVPIVRGGPVSRSTELILDEVGRRVAAGQREVVLTGVNLGSWRDDVSRIRLDRLLTSVADVDGVARVRISSIEPNHVDRRLVEVLATHPRVCPHLHVPLQSGDDAVLQAMGRHYDIRRYMRTIAAARDRLPGLNLTTDIIVGHPDEDDASFEQTLRVARELGFTKVHAFPFSARPGTRDAERAPVDPAVVAERSRRLRAQADELAIDHRSARVGEPDELLFEAARSGGYTRDYHPVRLVDAAGDPIDAGHPGAPANGTLLPVRLVGIDVVSGRFDAIASRHE